MRTTGLKQAIMIGLRAGAAAGALLAPLAAGADDGMHGLSLYGPQLAYGGVSGDGAIVIESETITLSPTKTSFDMVYANPGAKDIATAISVPLPDLYPFRDEFSAVADPDAENFMKVSVEQDDQPVKLALHQTADVAGMDVTAELKKAGLSLQPLKADNADALSGEPADRLSDWQARGIVVPNPDPGQGGHDWQPGWRLRSALSWNTTVPAGGKVHVVVRMPSSLGSNVMLGFMQDGKPADSIARYDRRYCLDDSFMKQAAKMEADAAKAGINLQERYLTVNQQPRSYYAGIGTYKVVIDKEDPARIVSFCGEDVKKTGPTTFEYTLNDAFPVDDLDVLFVEKLTGQAE